MATNNNTNINNTSPVVVIVEHPAPKALRFHILNTPPNSRAVVVVSCVTIDPPYRPHPHNLVGKEGCKKGVCTMEISSPDMTCEFSNLGIQCVKKKDIEESLKVRSEIRVDPFRTGFSHSTQPGSIDLNSLRLCFQVFLEGPERGQFKVPLKAVVSEPIYDKKAINDLTIMKLSDSSTPVTGGKEIIMLCDKVSKDDVEIRFYEESPTDGSVIWESFADFQPSDVHKQYAICFRTPQFRELEISTPRRVWIQLRCPSKDTTSAPRPFDYIPLSSGNGLYGKRKRVTSFEWMLNASNENENGGGGGALNIINFVNDSTSASSAAIPTQNQPQNQIMQQPTLEDLLITGNLPENSTEDGQSGADQPDIDSYDMRLYNQLNEYLIRDKNGNEDNGAGGGAAVATVAEDSVFNLICGEDTVDDVNFDDCCDYSSFMMAMRNPIDDLNVTLAPCPSPPPPRPVKRKVGDEDIAPPPPVPPKPEKKLIAASTVVGQSTLEKNSNTSSHDADVIKRKRQKLMADSNNSRLKEWFGGGSSHLEQKQSQGQGQPIGSSTNYYNMNYGQNYDAAVGQFGQSNQNNLFGSGPTTASQPQNMSQGQNQPQPPSYPHPHHFIKTEYIPPPAPCSPLSPPGGSFHNPNLGTYNQTAGGTVEPYQDYNNYDNQHNNNYSNISLPNLSDVNLSLLEEQLREGVEGVSISGNMGRNDD